MASFEEQRALWEKKEAIEAKLEKVMRLVMLSMPASFASGDIVPTDPELKTLAARGAADGLAIIRSKGESAEELTGKAAEYAAVPGGEAMVAAVRRRLANVEALRARAEKFVAFNRALASLANTAAEAARRRGRVVRSRKPNAKYYMVKYEW